MRSERARRPTAFRGSSPAALVAVATVLALLGGCGAATTSQAPGVTPSGRATGIPTDPPPSFPVPPSSGLDTTEPSSAPTVTPVIDVPGPDGWRRMAPDKALETFDLRNVVAGGPGYIAVGLDVDADQAAVRTSTDGRTWLPVTAAPSTPPAASPTPAPSTLPDGARAIVSGITAGGPGFVAVGWVDRDQGSTGAVWTSRDGLDWSRVADAPVFADASIASVANVGGHLVAVGAMYVPPPPDPEVAPPNPGHAIVWLSDDGAGWRRAADDPSFARGGMEMVAGGPLGFVAASGADPQAAVVWASSDGQTWRASGTADTFRDAGIYHIIPGGPGWIAVGSVGVDGSAWTSADGMTWTRSTGVEGALGSQLVDAAPVSNGFVGVGSGEAGAAVWKSTDGITWHRVADSPVFANAQIDHIVHGGSGLIALGSTFDVDAVNVNVVWTAPAP